MKKTETLVSVITMIGISQWKWGKEEDTLWYPNQDIIEVITAPMNPTKRGNYTIFEMAKYNEFTL